VVTYHKQEHIFQENTFYQNFPQIILKFPHFRAGWPPWNKENAEWTGIRLQA